MQGSGQAHSSATHAKERLYTQLAGSFGRMNRALVQTSNLCELLQMDLLAMRNFVGRDAAMLMTVAASLNDIPEDSFESSPKKEQVQVASKEKDVEN
ncbi:hypothetical protein D9757_010334 [Collybiopsis confluens]|uniref:Uncharacterized protein n=1 Tax=Collybiopsis confluens TaxID=2823264 RepID=A0A8H5C976_9AGAR|nr:hypothetical protein D9757_015089 [Collybiopsis confluens]KAF5367831.1 hypothetical protein D9757_010334 [Collybiopsis confluens]